jgi:uncharacterized SAM-binding protein YcdF (DUF218 family)
MISDLIMPLPIGLIILLIALIYLHKKAYFKSKMYLILSFVWISIFSYSQFSNFLLRPLETQYKTLETIPKNIKYIVLLGGDSKNRAWEALRLYHKIQDAKIITSGYSATLKESEAIKTARLLQSVGVPREDILIHSSPKDTKEEAVKIKEVLGSNPFILVTSSYHMPRAMKIFQNIGLKVTPSASDYQIKDSDKTYTSPDGYSLNKSTRAWHEYIGLLWFEVKNIIP